MLCPRKLSNARHDREALNCTICSDWSLHISMQATTGRCTAPLGAQNHACSAPVRPARRDVVCRAQMQLPAGGGGGSGDPSKLFQQHRVLMGAGFSYDQAALILQVSQQRRSSAAGQGPQSPAAWEVTPQPLATESPATASATTPTAAAPPDAVSGSNSSPAGMKTLEDRVAFLELELLKQALANNPFATSAADNNISSSTRSSSTSGGTRQGFSSTAAALNPVGAGAGGLNAAAAAASAGRWNADSVLYRQQPQGPLFDSSSSGNGSGDVAYQSLEPAVSISTQLAAAAELGQLDPDVYALADAVAIRQGFAGLPGAAAAAEPQLGAYGRMLSSQQQKQQQRRPASVWGRSGAAHYSRPLSANAWSANAWGEPLYDPRGEPLITRQDMEEEVPYNPSGWAVVGTIAVVYLGVLVTFLAVCMGDGVTDIPL